MHFLPIILAAIFGVVTTVPVQSAGIKERIFNVGVTRTEKIAEIKELLERTDISISTRNSVLESLILNVIDELRDLIINGSDIVPVLDPFILEELHLDLDDLVDLPNSHVTLNDVAVTNLGTFEIDQLTVTTVSIILQRYRVELDGRIPVLNAQAGKYDLFVNIFGGNVFGNGGMKLQVVNPRIYANVVVGLRFSISGLYLNVHECNIRVNLDAFEVNFTGLFGNEVASDFASTFISSLVPELLEFFEDDITEAVSTVVLEVANEVLADLNLIDLLP